MFCKAALITTVLLGLATGIGFAVIFAGGADPTLALLLAFGLAVICSVVAVIGGFLVPALIDQER